MKQKPHAGRRKGRKMPFLSLVTLTFDLDIQTRPSEGPNTNSSSLQIWCKSVQQFRDISCANKKKSAPAPKQNLTQFTACGNNKDDAMEYLNAMHFGAQTTQPWAVQPKGKNFRMSFGFSQCHMINAHISISRSCHTTAS